MDPRTKEKHEKPVTSEKLHPGSSDSDLQKEKAEMAKSANTATQEAGMNKSEAADQATAGLNKNDINKNIMDLQEEHGEPSAEDQARTDGPYGVQEEGYGADQDPHAEK